MKELPLVFLVDTSLRSQPQLGICPTRTDTKTKTDGLLQTDEYCMGTFVGMRKGIYLLHSTNN